MTARRPEARMQAGMGLMQAKAPSGRARGDHARAVSLSPERRREIARKAAQARWAARVPRNA
jgi:hypothetical protein